MRKEEETQERDKRGQDTFKHLEHLLVHQIDQRQYFDQHTDHVSVSLEFVVHT